MEGAIAEYRLALQEQPDDPLIHFNLGNGVVRERSRRAGAD